MSIDYKSSLNLPESIPMRGPGQREPAAKALDEKNLYQKFVPAVKGVSLLFCMMAIRMLMAKFT